MSRWIDADKLIDAMDKNPTLPSFLDVMRLIGKAPSIDIVRCKECKECFEYEDGMMCMQKSDYSYDVEPDGFCSYGERKESE